MENEPAAVVFFSGYCIVDKFLRRRALQSEAGRRTAAVVGKRENRQGRGRNDQGRAAHER